MTTETTPASAPGPEEIRPAIYELLGRLPRVRITPDTITQPTIDRWYQRERAYRAQIATLTAVLHRLAADERFTASDDGTLNMKDEAAARVAFAREQLTALGLAGIAAFKVLGTEDGELRLACPSAETIGCLYMPAAGDSNESGGSTATLADLMLAAAAHTGLAAGKVHAELAGATGDTPEGPDNDGNPAIHAGAAAGGGWVCAVPVHDRPDWICGHPVESEPCPEHRRPDWQPASPAAPGRR
jgi:hypothetical protein